MTIEAKLQALTEALARVEKRAQAAEDYIAISNLQRTYAIMSTSSNGNRSPTYSPATRSSKSMRAASSRGMSVFANICAISGRRSAAC